MAEDEAVEEQQPQKKAFPQAVIFVLVGMVLLSGIAFLGAKIFLKSSGEPDAKQTETGKAKSKKPYGQLFSFDQAIVVNLAETNGQRYLKVNLQMEMNEGSLLEELTARSPQIMDLIISILSSKTIEEASTTVGRNRLKRELVDRINAELISGKIVNIFFTEFVIQ